jgi:uncharacterized repeat protein (TIGR03803 family)
VATRAFPLIFGLLVSTYCSLSLAGCSAGTPQSLPITAPAFAKDGSHKGKLVVRVRIPMKHDRGPHYVSAATKGMTIAFAGPSNFTKTFGLTAGSNGCSGAPTTCTIDVAVPVGSYSTTIETYDAAPVNGSIPSGAKLLSIASNVPLFVKLAVANTLAVTLDGVPASCFVTALPAGASFGATAFSVTAKDADGDVIVGTYTTPIVLADSDASGATAIATTGNDKPPARELLGSSDVATLSYTGFPIPPATISASATGAASGSGIFTPVIGERVLHSFQGGADAAFPQAGLISVGGQLYGTTDGGGTNGDGTVFTVSASGSESVLHSFGSGTDGNSAKAPLVALGNEFYGTTWLGGVNSAGAVFEISTSGAESLSYNFKDAPDGLSPVAGLIAVGNELYGTTWEGGANGYGTVFEINSSGQESVLYSFKGGTDGATPESALTAVGNELYGTTAAGGANGAGTVFAVSTSGAESVLHSFGAGTDGTGIYSGLIAIGNELYGLTYGGGTNGDGTIFETSTSGAESVLYNFKGGTDGAKPDADLILVGGELYGTTGSGGTNDNGTVFAVSPSGAESVLYRFASSAAGESPQGALIVVGNELYGVTNEGGANGYGTVFAIP